MLLQIQVGKKKRFGIFFDDVDEIKIGTSVIQNTFSNTTDNFIFVQATGYLTDSPSAESNDVFKLGLTATYGGINISNTFLNVVWRNGTEKPIMSVNHTDITSGVYGIGLENIEIF